jgi:hypothetical protein
LAELALAAEDPAEQQKALSEGENIPGEGCVGHNHLWFYRDAMERHSALVTGVLSNCFIGITPPRLVAVLPFLGLD